jgi:hypothetical protein
MVFSGCDRANFVKRSSSNPVKQARLEWNYKTTVDAYQKSVFTGHKWNAPAIRALAEFACLRADVTETNEPWAEILSTNAAAAVQLGCNDPMVNYLFIKFAMDQTNSKEAYAVAFLKTADDMQKSQYPTIRKFYASLRTSEQFKYLANGNPQTPPEVHRYRRLAITNLADSLKDKFMPVGEVDDACHEMLGALNTNKKQYEDCYNLIENSLSNNWPDKHVVWLLKGEACVRKAWFARGYGYADAVQPEGWELFFEYFTQAELALKKAWQLNTNDERIPTQMISVAEGQQKSRDEMELWFNRAMAINPNCFEACKYKLHYLYPQWYGSREEMVNFGRQCVASTNWGGTVPLILVDAHSEYSLFLKDSEEKSHYWKMPEVWPDIKSAYDRFFELNPKAVAYYHNYAWYAYHAEQWAALNELIPKLGQVNYEFFGGKDKFDEMVDLAKEHTKKRQ